MGLQYTTDQVASIQVPRWHQKRAESFSLHKCTLTLEKNNKLLLYGRSMLDKIESLKHNSKFKGIENM